MKLKHPSLLLLALGHYCPGHRPELVFPLRLLDHLVSDLLGGEALCVLLPLSEKDATFFLDLCLRVSRIDGIFMNAFLPTLTLPEV